MGRRATPPKGKPEAKRSRADRAATAEDARIRDLEQRLAESLQRVAQALAQLQTRDRELTEAREQKTATAEILRVISTSPTDLQPVLDAVVLSAARFCGADDAELFRLDGDHLAVAAHHGPIPAPVGRALPVVQGSVSGRAFMERRAIHVADLQAETHDFPVTSAMARELGFRASLSVPLLREGMAVGTITLRRSEVHVFTEEQISLLQSFADQAVIAIENTRLFTELQTRNRELGTALETQTATSDILRIISASRTDAQPVFDAIVQSAVRLLRAYTGMLVRIAGDQLELVALTTTDAAGDAAVRGLYPRPLHSEGAHPQAIRDRAPVNFSDVPTDPRLNETQHTIARHLGFRSQVAVPLVGHDAAVGAISVTRREPGGFTQDEIALLQTFAEQAVIAIESVSLFNTLQARTGELTQSVEQLTALSEVGRAVGSTLDLDTVLTTIVSRAVQLSGADGGSIYEYAAAAEEFAHRATHGQDDHYQWPRREIRFRKGEGVIGQTAITLAPVQIPDITVENAYDSRLREVLVRSGVRALMAVPLLHEDHLVGGLVVNRRAPGEFPPEVVGLVQTFAAQSALAIQNARLYRRLEDKSREVEAASRHKSEFLANMSHELRTPLNAIIGYSELLEEEATDVAGGRLVPDLQKIATAAKHQLSLVNDVLDLSKVEAGRMELEVVDFDLPTAIDNALTLVRERATRRGISLGNTIDRHVGSIRGDERKVKQVLLNLLSNALKFTSEGGRVEVAAAVNGKMVEISVADTGVGIAPEDQEAVFEEFRQVGTAEKKVEGTGLGLALSRKFVELHGGRMWVQSQGGEGSTFTFSLPDRGQAEIGA